MSPSPTYEVTKRRSLRMFFTSVIDNCWSGGLGLATVRWAPWAHGTTQAVYLALSSPRPCPRSAPTQREWLAAVPVSRWISNFVVSNLKQQGSG